MQDLIISVIEAFAPPVAQANLIVFRGEEGPIPQQEGAAYFKRCKQYAKEHEAFVVTGLMNIADFLCVCMFSPNGRIAGAQRALFLSKENRDLYQRCDSLSVFDTPFGKVSFFVDADVYNPEVQRCARIKGCQIAVCTQYLPDYREQMLFSGGWGAAQTNDLLVILANNRVGAISAPYIATPDNSGYLARPAQSASAVFNVSRLFGIQNDYFSSHFNTALFAAQRELL